jgi:hypothetical protein
VPACSAPGTAHQVERARAGDLAEIADTRAAAFAHYAWTNWIVDEDGRQERVRDRRP